MTTHSAPRTSRRGLAITSVIVGALATAMMLCFWIIGPAADGQGLSGAAVLAVVCYYASMVVGVVGVLLGLIAVIVARPRYLGILGTVLSLVPIIAGVVAPAMQSM
jgi:hypothetical protein